MTVFFYWILTQIKEGSKKSR